MADLPTPPVDVTICYEEWLGKRQDSTHWEGKVLVRTKTRRYAIISLLVESRKLTHTHDNYFDRPHALLYYPFITLRLGSLVIFSGSTDVSDFKTCSRSLTASRPSLEEVILKNLELKHTGIATGISRLIFLKI